MGDALTIPGIVHQTWRSTALPPQIARCCASWKRLNPQIEYRFYDDKACSDFVRSEFPAYANLYEAMPHAVERADFFRYLVVYRFGGLYADVDVECVRPLDRFFSLSGAVFSIEANVTRNRQCRLRYAHPYQIANCMFAAPPRHPFLLSVIQRIAQMAPSSPHALAEVEDLTGPRMLTRLFYELRPADVGILHQVYWLPSLSYPDVFPLNKNVHARHHFWGSWKDATLASKTLRQRWRDRDLPPNPFPSTLLRNLFGPESAGQSPVQEADGLPADNALNRVSVPE